MDINALLDEADACHDDDPPRGAALLRQIDGAALEADRLPLYGFLINHVFGEKLGDWAEAFQSLTALLARVPAPPAVLYRHAAVAARLAGDDAASAGHVSSLATSAGGSAAMASELVALAAAALQAGSLPAAQAGAVALAALQPMAAPHWQVAGPFDTPAAAQCNNLASGLVERPLADLADPDLRAALALAASTAQQFWERAGTWVNHERARYLSAMAASALGDAAAALAHARAGLALLDAHDAENAESVDRAFLTLEASFALQRLGAVAEGAASRAQADALAAGFGDSDLEAWYADRVARNTALSSAG